MVSEFPPDADTEASAALGRFLMRVGPWVTQLQRQVLTRLDPPLGFAQYSVLARLGRGAASMAELRARSIVAVSTLSETTTSLVRLGLVERISSERDRRSVDLFLTERGRRVLADAEAAMEELASSLLEGVRAPTPEEFFELLTPLSDRVREVLTEHEHRAGS